MPAPAYSNAIPLATARVRVGRGPTPTWTDIDGLPDVSHPSQMPADDDITTFDSPGHAEENMPGILPAVDLPIEMFLVDGSPGDTALTALNVRDPDTGGKELHLLEIMANGKTVTHIAYLKEYVPIAAVKGRARMRATWRVMARVANAGAGGDD